jgi:hypothetical protein
MIDNTQTDEIDLLAELSKSTEFKDLSINEFEAENAHLTNPNDFDATKITDDTNINTIETVNTNEPKTESQTQTQTEQTINAKELADTIIEGTSLGLSYFLPKVYEGQLFTSAEKQKSRVFLQQARTKGQVLEITDEVLILMNKMEELDQYTETVPFTTDEKKYLKKNLQPVLENINIETTPQTALIICVLIVMLPRLSPVGFKYFEKKQSQNDTKQQSNNN